MMMIIHEMGFYTQSERKQKIAFSKFLPVLCIYCVSDLQMETCSIKEENSMESFGKEYEMDELSIHHSQNVNI